MSIEYSAPVSIDRTILAAIVQAIGKDVRYELLMEPNSNQIGVRIGKYLPRKEWTEDICLTWNNKLLVAFHSTERDDRIAILALLEATLLGQGSPVTFVEE
jgi:hypothetical protein